MIIDVHTHIFESIDSFPPAFIEGIYQSKRKTMGEEAAERWKTTLDGSIERLIRNMNEAGVDKSVVSPLDYGITLGEEPKISIWKINEYTAEAQSKYPDRIIGFVGVDPLRKDAIELLEKGVGDWGLKGVKLLFNAALTDERIQPFMNKLNELEIPVLVHQGAEPRPCLIKHYNPEELDCLTTMYPKIRVIAAHVAIGYEDILLAIMKYKAGTIYTDISSWQYDYWQAHWHFILQLRYLLDKIPNAVLMGSDWPWLTEPPQPTHKEWFDVIRNLKMPEPVLQSGLGIKDFSQEEKDKLLGKNARTLLGI